MASWPPAAEPIAHGRRGRRARGSELFGPLRGSRRSGGRRQVDDVEPHRGDRRQPFRRGAEGSPHRALGRGCRVGRRYGRWPGRRVRGVCGVCRGWPGPPGAAGSASTCAPSLRGKNLVPGPESARSRSTSSGRSPDGHRSRSGCRVSTSSTAGARAVARGRRALAGRDRCPAGGDDIHAHGDSEGSGHHAPGLLEQLGALLEHEFGVEAGRHLDRAAVRRQVVRVAPALDQEHQRPSLSERRWRPSGRCPGPRASSGPGAVAAVGAAQHGIRRRRRRGPRGRRSR